MTDASDQDKKIGYKRPPLHTRFKPGASGNPRGRPKGGRNFATDLKRVLGLPVSLKDKGRAKRVSTQEALMLRLRDKALKGDARSLDTLLTLARTLAAELGADGERPVVQEDQAIIDAFLEDAKAIGEPSKSPNRRDDDHSDCKDSK